MQATELIQDFLDRIHNDEIYLTEGYTASQYSYIIGTGENPIYEITDVNHDGSPELFISIVNKPDYSVMYYVKDGEVVEATAYIIFGHSGDGEILASDRWNGWCGHLSWDGQDWVEVSDSTYEELMEECVTFSDMTDLKTRKRKNIDEEEKICFVLIVEKRSAMRRHSAPSAGSGSRQHRCRSSR